MPANPRLAAPATHAPRNALWCHAHVRAAFDDLTVTALASVEGLAVRVADRSLASGVVAVDVVGWRWTTEEPDLVGELVLSAPGRGLALVGWWSPTDESVPRTGQQTVRLEMDVAGATLWSGQRRASTEDAARISALLGG